MKYDISWLANLLALTATYLMATKIMLAGFVMLLCASVIFIVWGFMTKQWSFFVFNIAFAANSSYGIYRWML